MTTPLEDLVRRIFDEHATTASLRALLRNGGLIPSLWTTLSETGMTRLGIDQVHGGEGGTADDVRTLLQVGGQYGLPAPILETWLAAWAGSRCGLPIDDGPLSIWVAPDLRLESRHDTVRIHGTVDAVPWARQATQLLMLVPGDHEPSVLSLRPDDYSITTAENLAGEPRDHLSVDACLETGRVVAGAPIDSEAFMNRHTAARAATLAGAIGRVNAIARQHAQDRVQFGQPISRFQAVQRHLTALQEATVLAAFAAKRAFEAIDEAEGHNALACAAVVVVAAARDATRSAHQICGAIGATEEHDLHLFTRRLMAWRMEVSAWQSWSSHVGMWTIDHARNRRLWTALAPTYGGS